MLLHLVDIAPLEESETPAEEINAIVKELENFDAELAGRERWLILNKADLLPDSELEDRKKALIQTLDWQGQVHLISALSGQGCESLCYQIMQRLEQKNDAEKE